MPELMISHTPIPRSSGTEQTDGPKQLDTTNRSGESAETDGRSGKEVPFAAVLKSRMAEQKTDATAGSSTNPTVASAPADAETSNSDVDLSALLPLLLANSNETTGLEPTSPGGGKPLPETTDCLLPNTIQPVADQPPAQLLLALSTTAVVDTGSRKQNAEASDETPVPAAAKSSASVQTSGKIPPDAAITAEIGQKNTERNAPEAPANDFRALMDRAATVAPGLTATESRASSTHGLGINTPFGHPGWHNEIGQKLTWMISNDRQQADLVLTPPQLGRVEVSLTMNGDQATATFTSPNPAVREALEGSLQRLREALADAGVSLGQANVGSESPNRSARREELDFNRDAGSRYAMAVSSPGPHAVAQMNSGRGMIDVFA